LAGPTDNPDQIEGGRTRAYNEDDCRSLYELHQWLGGLRPADLPWRPLPEGRDVQEETKERLEERARVRKDLLEGAEEGEPLWLLAHLLDYHRRAEKPQWWEYFHHKTLDEDELLDDGDTIGGLEVAGEPEPVKKSLRYTFTFPAQEHKIHGTGVDPKTERVYDTVKVDDERGTLTLVRGPKVDKEPLPRALIPPQPLPTWVQRDAILRFATNMEAYPAPVEILERRPPRARLGGSLEDAALSLDGSYLFVQGPPGSGKTWNGARMAIALMRAGQRVGVTALTHKAIHKFLEDLEDAAIDSAYEFKGMKKASGSESEYEGRGLVGNARSNEEMLDVELQLLAGTSFFFSRDDLNAHLDTLFIDEGGQFSLADALAVGTAARNFILLGDPNQLAQVSQGTHPAGADASVLSHLLGEEQTVRPDMGLFLAQTWRMRPEVNDYISNTFYEGRLQPAPAAYERSLERGNGIRFLPIAHEGQRTQSFAEAEAVAAEISRLVGTPYEDEHGRRVLTPKDVVVVAPYNAHVRCLRQKIPNTQVRIGTVDKFQGQQAAVVFYSMASSSAEDVPRGLDFLFSRNRLNVAISRAKCLAYLVASPRLLEANCRTVEQMRLANALCHLVETAETL
jgi:uncharacterized protein